MMNTARKKTAQTSSLLIIVAILIFTSSSSSIANMSMGAQGSEAQPPYDWVFMAYMMGDNSLTTGDTDYLIKDLAEMKSVGSDARLLIIVLCDGGDYGDTRLYKVVKNGTVELSAPWLSAELNLGTADVLSDFITWCADNYPAARYFLVLWNHGEGWISAGVDKNGGRSADRLTMAELRSAISDFVAAANRRIDIIGFDACNMAMAEVFYQISGYANYSIASEKEEDANGWPYDAILARIKARPELDAAQVCRIVVDEYVNWCMRNSTYSATMVAVDLDSMESVVNATKALAHELKNDMYYYYEGISAAWNNAERYEKAPYPVDFYDFCHLLINNTNDTKIRVLCSAVILALNSSIVHERHYDNPEDNVRVNRSHGISIYLPKYSYERTYEQTLFGAETRWGDFVSSFASAYSINFSLNVSCRMIDSDLDNIYDTMELNWSTNYNKDARLEVFILMTNGSWLQLATENKSWHYSIANMSIAEISLYLRTSAGVLLNSTCLATNTPMNVKYEFYDTNFDNRHDMLHVSWQSVPAAYIEVAVINRDRSRSTHYITVAQNETLIDVSNAEMVVIYQFSSYGVTLNYTVILLGELHPSVFLYYYDVIALFEGFFVLAHMYAWEKGNLTLYVDDLRVSVQPLRQGWNNLTMVVANMSATESPPRYMSIVITAGETVVTRSRVLWRDYRQFSPRTSGVVLYGSVLWAEPGFNTMIVVKNSLGEEIQTKIGRQFYIALPENFSKAGDNLTIDFLGKKYVVCVASDGYAYINLYSSQPQHLRPPAQSARSYIYVLVALCIAFTLVLAARKRVFK